MPYIDTPFSQAIFKMFDNLDLDSVNTLPNQSSNTTLIKAYLFGGCAVHIHTGSRATNDVDAKLERVGNFSSQSIEVKPVYFQDESGLRKTLIFDRNFNTSLATLDPAYEDRAIWLYTTKSDLVKIYLVSAVDIAVSKLGRFEINDRLDIKNLYKENLFSIDEFLQVAYEAQDYCAVKPDDLSFNIRDAENILKEVSR